MTLPREVFLSHSHLDEELLGRLSVRLTDHGIPHWFAEREILGSQRWHDEIGAALERCDWFLILLTPAAVESVWVKRELLYALRHVDRFGDRIVPLLGEPCRFESLSWTLGAVQYVPLVPDFDAGMRALLRIWGVGYRG